jgi:hypothetical protein
LKPCVIALLIFSTSSTVGAYFVASSPFHHDNDVAFSGGWWFLTPANLLLLFLLLPILPWTLSSSQIETEIETTTSSNICFPSAHHSSVFEMGYTSTSSHPMLHIPKVHPTIDCCCANQALRQVTHTHLVPMDPILLPTLLLLLCGGLP